MSSQIEQSLNACKSLEQAWNAVIGQGLRSGIIFVVSEHVNGSIAFTDGNIVFARIDETGLQGEHAFKQLAGITGARFAYIPPSPLNAPVNQRTEPQAAADTDDPWAAYAPPLPVRKPAGATENEFREFLANTGALTNTDDSLPEQKKKLLEMARQFSDEEAFQHVAYPDLHSTQGLSERQQQVIQALVRTADVQAFSAHTGALDDARLALNEEQIWMLGEVLLSRSTDDQKREFVEIDSRMRSESEHLGRAFSEPEMPPPPEGQTSPKGLSTPAFASDFKRSDIIDLDNEKAKQSGFGALTSSDDAGVVRRSRLRVARYKKFLAPAVMASLCLALFTVPAVLRGPSQMSDDDELWQQQTDQMMDEELQAEAEQRREQKPVAAQPASQAVLPQPQTPAPSASAGESAQSEPAQSPLVASTSQTITVDANDQDALEKALAANPQSLQLRIALVRLYKAKKDFKRARQLAVLGFNLPNATSEERNELWRLFKECQ